MQTQIATIESSAFELTTTDNKGNVRGFVRSIAFASKDARWGVASQIYEAQCKAGRYGQLIRDTLDEGIVGKGQREVIDMMLTSGSPSKSTARMFCAIVLGLADKATNAGKPAKGKKQFLINMVAALSAMIGVEDNAAADAKRTVDAA